MRLVSTSLLLLSLIVSAAACASGGATSPSPSSATGRVVITVQVADERYRIELTDPADIAIARRLAEGKEAPSIPNGLVVRGDPGVNTGYSWHIDPEDVEFADMTTEVCDGRPSDVEANAITSDRYCPWDAKVVKLEE